MYEKALKLNPRAVGARFNLAMLFEKKGDVAGAKAQYRTILETNPDDLESHISLGIILSKSDPDGAQTEYLAVLAIYPTHSNALNLLTLFLKDRGDLTGAEEKYQAAIKSDPGNGDARGSL